MALVPPDLIKLANLRILVIIAEIQGILVIRL
jgi:hypothetical protein